MGNMNWEKGQGTERGRQEEVEEKEQVKFGKEEKNLYKGKGGGNWEKQEETERMVQKVGKAEQDLREIEQEKGEGGQKLGKMGGE